jgi:hypothetical protein
MRRQIIIIVGQFLQINNLILIVMIGKKNVLNNNHLASYQQTLKNKAIIVLKI